MSQTVIKAENISKRYRIGIKEEKAKTFAEQLYNYVRYPYKNFQNIRKLGEFSSNEESIHWAIKDINFEVRQGEVLGIIGKNGAGKSTLLKVLSKITEPSSGRILIHGRIAALLEVGTGFHPELTGRENIYMNGTILGMSKKEIDKKLDEIVDFSGVDKYIDTAVKFYSSGMRVRLGFSVAAHLEPEILVVDEVLSVGDAEFQNKCLGKMQSVSENEGRTILFVSHDLNAVYKLTSKCMLLHQGEIQSIGGPDEIIRLYRSNLVDSKSFYLNPDKLNGIVSVEILTSSGLQIHEFGKPLEIQVKVRFNQLFKNVAIAFQFVNELGQSIINPLVTSDKIKWIHDGIGEISLLIPYLRLFAGKYSLTIHLGDKSSNYHIETIEDACQFEISMDHLHSEYGWNRKAAFYLESHLWKTKDAIYESDY